ncbi:glycosyltransferase [Flavobacterium sp.]|jgi:glycosyltransferase involved in cell wall biosynthesis|uniref:glycosyltransferase n=1 Tax=Flavobacterium sp. TaxID=239 RepID=UPI0037BF415F
MNVFFIGCFYPEIRENQIRQDSKISLDYAANNFQSALIAGLDHYYANLKLITQPNIGAYPSTYKKLFFKQTVFSHNGKSNDYCLGFVNIPYFKLISKKNSLLKHLKKQLVPSADTTLIIYNLHSPFLKAAMELKKTRKNLKICLVVPDLPQFMSENNNPIYLFLKRIDKNLLNKYLEYVDSFVLLNESMVHELKVKNRPWVLIEGIYKSENEIKIQVKKEVYKTILYTGNIDERYGIKTLVDAFGLIKNPNYRLWIRGSGSSLSYVKNAAMNDSRIIYFDQMSKDELIALQKKATILINPVSSSQEFTKCFFPSKTMDYMASCTPTLMTRLQGVPNEYYNYVYTIEDEDANGIKNAILDVCNKEVEELNLFGEKAANFIFENKNHLIQVKKIYEMLKKI